MATRKDLVDSSSHFYVARLNSAGDIEARLSQVFEHEAIGRTALRVLKQEHSDPDLKLIHERTTKTVEA